MDNRVAVGRCCWLCDHKHRFITVVNDAHCSRPCLVIDDGVPLKTEDNSIASKLNGFPSNLENWVAGSHVDRDIAVSVGAQGLCVLCQQFTRFALAQLPQFSWRPLFNLNNVEERDLCSQSVPALQRSGNCPLRALGKVHCYQQMLDRIAYQQGVIMRGVI
jgi:hypothetical protein